MSKPIEQGVSRNGHAFIRIGNHGYPLCLIDDLHFRPKPVEGLTLQGMLQVYEKYLERHQLLYLFRNVPPELLEQEDEEQEDEEQEDEEQEDEQESGSGTPPAEEAEAARRESGESGEPGQDMAPPTIESEAESYLNALFDFGFPRVHLMGVGYGGMVALKVAATAPQLFRSLVLVAAGPRLPEPMARELRRLADLARSEQWRELHAGLAAALHDHSRFRRFFSTVAWSLPKLLGIPGDPERVAGILEAYAGADLREELPRIKTPTLFVAGAKDPYLEEEQLRLAAETIGEADLALWEGEGHSILRAKPEEVEERILSFLASQE
ncbi:MAG: alpha/beta fold hydrolase [Alkalispirochaetaceae bacterium]